MHVTAESLSDLDIKQIGSARVPATTDVRRPSPHNELIWMLEGRATLTVSGQDVTLSPSMLVLYPPQDEMRFRGESGVVVRIGLVHFDGSIGLEAPFDAPFVRDFKGDDVLRTLLDHLMWLGITTPPRGEERARYLLPYVLETLTSAESEAGADRVGQLPPSVQQAIELVAERWMGGPLRSVSLDDLAEAASLSREHVTRLFRHHFGVPPVTAIRLLRLERAAGLLQHTDLPIREIALHCGFANEYHFSSAFKQLAGVPPRRYRQRPIQASLLPSRVRRLYWNLEEGQPRVIPRRARPTLPGDG